MAADIADAAAMVVADTGVAAKDATVVEVTVVATDVEAIVGAAEATGVTVVVEVGTEAVDVATAATADTAAAAIRNSCERAHHF